MATVAILSPLDLAAIRRRSAANRRRLSVDSRTDPGLVASMLDDNDALLGEVERLYGMVADLTEAWLEETETDHDEE
jgi:hypothetical protein